MKALLFANTSWYLYNFRLPLAQALRERGHEVILLSPADEYSPLLIREGFRWVRFDFETRSTNPLRELETTRRLLNVYRREKPDVVHHFTVKCVLYGSLAAHLTGTTQIINSITGLGYIFSGENPGRRLLQIPLEIIYRRLLKGTAVIFQNPDDRALFLRKKMVQVAQAHLIRGSGVDIRRFTPNPEPPGLPVVILPARLLRDKGIIEFVEAARLLKSRGVDARFVLVGEVDPNNPSTITPQQVREWEQKGLVESWGWRTDMEKIYASAHIVCLPSYREGVPKSLLEAAAAGRPIVTTDAPGCREVVRHGENGLLVPPRQVQPLAEALRQLIEDAGARARMGARSRSIAESEFALEKVISATLALYSIAL